ncbi:MULTISPECIES: helix-turn-helix domain-containing protein [Microvirgula]|nr:MULTISPECIES: transcriptional regulator [Microvirgula]RAS19000.1 hypothetical protein DFO50_102156 [Microvirgula sp. AG722]
MDNQLSHGAAQSVMAVGSRKPFVRKLFDNSDVIRIREGVGLTQKQFWSPLGISQSGGSRYERGYYIPKPVRILLNLLYVRHVDIEALNEDDLKIVHYLRDQHPELYASLAKMIKRKG